jgi:hypothetical protein
MLLRASSLLLGRVCMLSQLSLHPTRLSHAKRRSSWTSCPQSARSGIHLLVPTKRGVRERQNHRVEIMRQSLRAWAV